MAAAFSNRTDVARVDRRGFVTGTVALAVAAPAYARRADKSKVINASIDLLRPSQGAVGMREVAIKIAEVGDLARKPDKLAKFLLKEALPVVRGPAGGLHLNDHHHLGRALWEAKYRDVQVEVIGDLTALAPGDFWAEMEKRRWLHAYDAKGVFVGPDKLPQHVKDMGDDAYRSLAGAVRNAAGYQKTDVPFAEFKWADFLRVRVVLSTVERNFDDALKQASQWARSPDAAFLPGFSGLKKAT